MYESFEQKELSNYLSNPEVRHLYVDSSIRHLLAMQLRSMREAMGWRQDELGQKAEMKQSAIARLEDPRYSSMTLSTLKRLAKAFDVALIVRFAPFSEFISWTVGIDEPRLSPPSFVEEQNVALTTIPSGWDRTEDRKDIDANNPIDEAPETPIFSLTATKERELANVAH
jgi:transcriptional regulator with XRE-family HTH domain